MAENNIQVGVRLISFAGFNPGSKVGHPAALFNVTLLVGFSVTLAVSMLSHFHWEQLQVVCYFFNIGSRMATLLVNKKHVVDLLEATKKMWTVSADDKDNALYLKYFKYLYYYLLCAAFTMMIMILTPYLTNAPSLFYCYYPTAIPHILVLLTEVYMYQTIVRVFSGTGIILSSQMILIVAQFRLLNKKIRRMDFSQIRTSNDLQRCLQELKEVVEYHNFLLLYIKQLNVVISMPFLIQLVAAITLICINLYTVQVFEATVIDWAQCALVNMMLILENFFLYGLPAQLLMDQAAELGDSIYCHTQWYLPNIIPVRKYLLLMILRSQRRVCISIEGFIDINNTTVLFLMKTVYSLYTFLQMATDK